jgi:hypothetical protein
VETCSAEQRWKGYETNEEKKRKEKKRQYRAWLKEQDKAKP